MFKPNLAHIFCECEGRTMYAVVLWHYCENQKYAVSIRCREE